MNNTIKSSEKAEQFKKLGQAFMMLTQEIDVFDDENVITAEKYNMLVLKYDNLINDCDFEDIPTRYKLAASKSFNANNRHTPIQLNGTINNHIEMVTKKPTIILENI